jgi:hypothetical protein
MKPPPIICDWCGKEYQHVKDHNGKCPKAPNAMRAASSNARSKACLNRHHANCKTYVRACATRR